MRATQAKRKSKLKQFVLKEAGSWERKHIPFLTSPGRPTSFIQEEGGLTGIDADRDGSHVGDGILQRGFIAVRQLDVPGTRGCPRRQVVVARTVLANEGKGENASDPAQSPALRYVSQN